MEYLKFIDADEDTLTVEGYLAVWDGSDLTGERFHKSTNFDSSYTAIGRLPIDYEHGQQPDRDERGKAIPQPGRDDVLGYVDYTTARKDDIGLLARHALNRRDRYVREFIEPMVKANLLGTSSEAVPEKVVKRKDGTIDVWPLKRLGYTFQPAEPRLLKDHQLQVIKSLSSEYPFLKAFIPQAAQDTATDDATEAGDAVSKTIIEITEQKIMSEHENAPAVENQDFVTRTQFENVTKSLDTLTALLENAPALKQAGYVAPDSEADHPQVKSFGDYLVAVKRGNTKRLEQVYKSAKDISSQSGAAGGYLIPDEFHARLMEIQQANSQILARVTRQPVATDAGRFPALDYTVTPTAGSGQTALAAGLSAATTAPGSAYTEDQPTFKEIAYAVRKVGGYTEVENEVIADSPFAIESLLTRLFGVVVTAKVERDVLRGTGAGEPLGILNAACAIGVTTASDNVFAWADATNMVSRFKSMGGQPVWVIHPSIWPDIGNFETSNGGGVWQANMQGGLGTSLLGYPILVSEHMPQANGDAVLLADLSAYILFERQMLSVAYSEHAAFTSGKGTWRFDYRLDGMPWLTGAITLADPTGSFTVSPFVYHND